ncbi:efflux RND transporter periplasmic adaptor subunit [Anaeromyxobacter diazotrophicus]|uniref:RND transporter n=1 Tax=Anaeromyxobacter diazotrophicus TaxID=2590199 RepID=A0A7I9VMG1_9BACT|nr:efflux RND transporter periplasmic adaptor subunit [Anaeromyxobacter diazotrophicus]GEJ57388.1 RND transporter [Anaeromyxobacter diazotrophicus]
MRALHLAAYALPLALAACGSRPHPAYRTDRVTRGGVAEVVSATGDVSAVVTVNVGSQVSGTISKLYADFNTPVKKDQVVAEIDPRLFQAALERAVAGLAAAEADVAKAKAALADAQRTERRSLELQKRNLIAAADVDAALAAREGAEAALQGAAARVLQARADRDTALTNVQLCRIRSPIDGIVISRSVDVGQTVAASLQAPTLFLIANDLTRMQILANVDEADVGKVKEGLAARFTVDAFPGEQFEGKIREVRQAPSTIQNVVTYAAVIDAPNPERKLRQGMTASVTIVTKQVPEALRVPNAALRFRPAGDPGSARPGGEGRPGAGAGAGRVERTASADGAPRKGVRRGRVYQLRGGQLAPAEVELGISDGRQTELLSGLEEGDEVVTGDGSGAGGPPQGGPRRGLF